MALLPGVPSSARRPIGPQSSASEGSRQGRANGAHTGGCQVVGNLRMDRCLSPFCPTFRLVKAPSKGFEQLDQSTISLVVEDSPSPPKTTSAAPKVAQTGPALHKVGARRRKGAPGADARRATAMGAHVSPASVVWTPGRPRGLSLCLGPGWGWGDGLRRRQGAKPVLRSSPHPPHHNRRRTCYAMVPLGALGSKSPRATRNSRQGGLWWRQQTDSSK